jgi:hypothetical protein
MTGLPESLLQLDAVVLDHVTAGLKASTWGCIALLTAINFGCAQNDLVDHAVRQWRNPVEVSQPLNHSVHP